MVNGSIVGQPRPASSLNATHVRGNALPLNIPRNLSRPSQETYRESLEYEQRSSRYQSPNRFTSESIPSSHGAEGTSPFSLLQRPKDKRRMSTSAPVEPRRYFSQENFARKEGFDTPVSTSQPSSVGSELSRLQPAAFSEREEVPPSPSKQPGLLSRTFSSNLGNTDTLKVAQERLESCLGSRPSLGQDVDGESLSYLRNLQADYPVFQSSAVGVAYNIASFAYNDKERDRLVMKQCVKAACILASLGADESIVAAALLKDVLLQSMMTEKQLRGLVPKQIADLVVNVGKLDDICQVRQQMVAASEGAVIDQETSQKINHLLMTLADYRGVLIKLADHLAALQIASKSNAPDLQTRSRETLEVFAPIANRIGVWSIKAALEDLAFKALHPKEHSELHTKLKESRNRGTIETALDDLSKVLQTKDIGGVDLSGRPKSLYGVMRKMHDKRKGLDQVYDVRALRVLVQSKNDCYAVLREVYRLWPEVDGCFKDYIRNPKPNGYQSLHTVVQLPDGRPMEIQIRTDKMHFIAEYGVAAHWRYKEKDSTSTNQSEEQQVNWARMLISWSLEYDSKCRPKGSPPGESRLASLANQICSFPTHKPECKFAAWASSFIPKPVTEEELAERPVMIVCLDHTRGHDNSTITIKELPPKSRIEDLAAQIGVDADSHILVNMVESYDNSQLLASGDRIEVFAAPSSRKLSKSQLEDQRERLQRMFRHSPSNSAKSNTVSGNMQSIILH